MCIRDRYIINKVKEETGMYDAKVVVTGGLGRIISNETENVDVLCLSYLSIHKSRLPAGDEMCIRDRAKRTARVDRDVLSHSIFGRRTRGGITNDLSTGRRKYKHNMRRV